MLISADVKSLEVVCAAYLSRDQVLLDELLHGIDVHGENQKAFGFPDRKCAKRFKFKMIYGGTAFGFTEDPDFRFLKWRESKWHDVIETYYTKYFGIRSWHRDLIDKSVYTGKYESVSGRIYDYRELLKQPDWYYIPKLKNYPVQGLGADIVKIARISLKRRLDKHPEYGLLISTVHDDIRLDIRSQMLYNVIYLIDGVFADLPENLSKIWKIDWDLPISVEYKTLDGKEIERNV